MADIVEEIVDRAIEHSRTLLAAALYDWRVARQGLWIIHGDLSRRAPEHPALNRLEAFIARENETRGVG
jgi:hypothetical protein